MAGPALASQIDTPSPSAFRDAYQRALAHSADAGTAWASLRAAAFACRDELATRWLATQAQDRLPGAPRRVHYMSMEFLMGRMLGNALAALGLEGVVQDRWPAPANRSPTCWSMNPSPAWATAVSAGLAACFLDAFATLGLPSFGYGVRYEYGMFAQAIAATGRAGRGSPTTGCGWAIRGRSCARSCATASGFGGRVEGDGGARRWAARRARCSRCAYDFIVPGHGTRRVSTLRLWSASSDDGRSTSPPSAAASTWRPAQHRLAADAAELGAVSRRLARTPAANCA